MNAPLPPEARAVATLPVAAITPSPSNPRKHFDDAYIAELAESIKAHGLIQPITVRPLPLERHFEFNRKNIEAADHPAYELVVGECRWRAAKLAGLTEVPGFWRELDDKAVLEIQVIENLQRRDVHPIEEAEGYEQLMQRHGYKADEIAAKIGKSRGYVYARLKLTALCPPARDAFFAGRLDASTALLVARIPGAALQKRAVKEITESYDGQPLSYRNAKNHIRHHFTISLKQATFPLDDADLVPAAGACATCPKRSGNAIEICADLEDEDVCTDTACFEDKRLTRRQQLIDHAEKRGITVFSGDKAKEIAPYGLGSLKEDLYVNLDETVEGDAQERTYREILGDQLPVAALLETGHGRHEVIVELGEPTALAKALRKAGWQPDLLKTTEEQEAAQQDRQQREAEKAERDALDAAKKDEAARLRQLRDDILARLNDDSPLDRLPELVYLFAGAFIRREHEYGDVETEYLERYGYPLPEEYDPGEETPKIIDAMNAWPLRKVMAFLFEYLLYEDARVSYDWKIGDPTPANLSSLAEFVGLYPTQAAQAQGEGAADSAAPAKPKGKKKATAKKNEAKADPAPASPANEPAAPVKTLGNWPFPRVAEAA